MFKSFFKSIQEHITENIDTITCSEFRDLYVDFVKAHNEYGGGTKDLTGFSEFLVSNYLGAYFRGKGEIQILHDKPLVGRKLQHPDFQIWNNEELVGLVSVKANTAGSIKMYGQDKERLENVKQGNTPSITICFYKGNAGLKSIQKIEQTMINHKFIILEQEGTKSLKEAIDQVFR
ncbi:hypothetical protein [Rossellomorea marisflavi]|uniref:hypothetical protein n=1 Tax=Rossellomorea marisflavi TaxID=189381 RepID=UPI00345D1A90